MEQLQIDKYFFQNEIEENLKNKDILINIPFKNSEVMKHKYLGSHPDISFLNGKKILKAGFIDANVEGGLTIDYLDGEETKRLILGFNDIGSWIISNF